MMWRLALVTMWFLLLCVWRNTLVAVTMCEKGLHKIFVSVFVTLAFDLSRSNCFGKMIRTPYVSRTLTNVAKGSIFKFGPRTQNL